MSTRRVMPPEEVAYRQRMNGLRDRIWVAAHKAGITDIRSILKTVMGHDNILLITEEDADQIMQRIEAKKVGRDG
jgi:hypothetical protein